MNHDTATPGPDSAAELPRSLRQHLGWQTLFEVVGSVGAPGAFIAYRFWSGGFPEGWFDGFVFFGLFIAGYLVARAVFRHFIGAACPDCHGRAFPRGTAPMIYVCRSCQRRYPTEVFEGDDGMVGPEGKV